MERKRVAILISGRGSNMAALIGAAESPDYPAEIALVVSNRPEAAGLARAKADGIATLVIDHKPFGKDRAAFEQALDCRTRGAPNRSRSASRASCACSPHGSCPAGRAE